MDRHRFLIAPGAACAIVFAVISINGHFAARSSFETPYVGSIQSGIDRKYSGLSKAGIVFEASLDGTNLSADYRDKGPRHEQH
jgi:flagellar M-ring protein FliF